MGEEVSGAGGGVMEGRFWPAINSQTHNAHRGFGTRFLIQWWELGWNFRDRPYEVGWRAAPVPKGDMDGMSGISGTLGGVW